MGFRRQLAPGLTCTTGYVLAANEHGRADAPKTPEHRFYQEIALAELTGAVRTSHRLRVEERWLRPLPEAAFRSAPALPAAADGAAARRRRPARGQHLPGGRR